MSAASPADSKRRLRRELRRQLGALPPEARRAAAAAAERRLLATPELETAGAVLCCLSFGIEIDTRGLVERLAASGRKVYVPRADFASGRLHLHPYPCELGELPFGLEQPLPDAPQLPDGDIDSTLDAAILVGLAFDRRGFRLGHGGGFFDRFLVDRPFPSLGFAFDVQLVERLPVEDHDRPVTAVITDLRTVRPPAR